MKGAAMSELTIKDFKSKYQPIGLSMELKSQGQSAYETGKIGGHTPLYTDEQIQDYLSNQPQLTIPKSIADEIEEKKLDDYGVFQTLAQKKHIISDPEPFCDLSDGFISWCENNEKWWAIMNAYLAGKALGVYLVKVVADD